MLRFSLVVMALLTALPARAHDSWFAPLPAQRAGEVRFALATGTSFPLQEWSVGEGAPQSGACLQGTRPARQLHMTRDTPKALLLRAAVGPGAFTCWVQMLTLEVIIAPDIVPNYFKEINASPELMQTWAAMQARGVVWKERYTKHARYESFAVPRKGRAKEGSREPAQAAATPVLPAAPMGMDIVLESFGHAPRAGEALSFTLLRDGQPLAHLPVELKGETEADSFWATTDAAGRAEMRLPRPGRWLLRAVDLRLSPAVKDEWESRFVALTFEVR